MGYKNNKKEILYVNKNEIYKFKLIKNIFYL